MSKEAMKLVLEALEAAVSDDQPYIVRCKEAIKSLREALAEQPAQQEPVAVVDDTGVIVVCSYKYKPGGKLYTSPPAQRKPLTDDEIESINVRLAGSRDLARLFARAIEAAHGIKENT